jgi:hypothetical protein
MPRLLIPTGRWKVVTDAENGRTAIRLSGQALCDASQLALDRGLHNVLLTCDQAHELVSGLNNALRELELQRTAPRGGIASDCNYAWPED